jgi:phosphoglycerate dehydrogenase-like enzyme
MALKVLLTGHVSEELLRAVRETSPRVEVVTGEQVRQEPALIEEIEVVYGGLGREQIARACRLRWMQLQGAGVNGMMTPELLSHPVRITNASGIHAEPITEQFFGMLLTLTRRLHHAWDGQRDRQWRRPEMEEVGRIAGRTLGILGVGAIGSHAARVGAAFGMRVIGLRRTGEPAPHVERMFGAGELEPFLREADVVLDTLPLTPATARLLDARAFAWMKPGAIVANIGRGGTIDTDALVDALRSGHLGGALLDVTDPEPLPNDHPLWSMQNVLITAHYSGAHAGYEERAARIFLDNLRRYLASEPLVNLVDKAEGY